MQTKEKIRQLRKQNHWSQEQMAEKMHMSPSNYAKLERGETKLNLDRLSEIAQIFQVDVAELIDKGLVCVISENNSGTHYGNYYHGGESLIAENDKLQLIIAHKDELLAEKDKQLAEKDKQLAEKNSELQMLKDVIDMLKNNTRTP